MQDTTPMLRQYLEIKKKYPGTILFFRLGDFYEMFNEDAIIGSKVLEITLTARQKSSKNPIPMCGVPHHAAPNYIARLIRKGFRVAICEQTEEATPGKSLVKREVVRVITPGTAIDPQLVDSKEMVYLAAVCGSGERFGAAFLELSTGQFLTTQFEGPAAFSNICADIESFAPRELLFPKSLEKLISGSFTDSLQNTLADGPPNSTQNYYQFSAALTPLDDSKFGDSDCLDLLKQQMRVRELSGFGLEGKTEAIRASGACLGYARETQKAAAKHISGIEYYQSNDFMVLDAVTLRNLEVVESRDLVRSNKRSLLGIIDQTVTGMGARLLRSWVLRPSVKRNEIQTRLAAVSELTDLILRDKLRFLLKEIADLERLIGRLNLGTASPRDLLALKDSLSHTPKIVFTLSDATALLLRVLSENIYQLPDIIDLIARSMTDEPPANISDGGVIRNGFDPELDELRDISSSAKQTIAAFEAKEKERTGISNLKVKFNNVFGYFIEVSKSNTPRVPEDYERRQTLTNAERYTTPQLKEWEAKVLGAEEKIKVIEAALFQFVRSEVAKETQKLQSTARALAAIDVLSGLAETATRRNFVAPQLHDGDQIDIVAGRHPIVEALGFETFIPNDLILNNSTDRLLIITGANMSGKSTIMRQIALIQILAQIGSFVPAKKARLPIIDRVWTRVGASDDLASGRSTFMVEMTETAAIMHNATPRSLILLDEIGRGTSTFDGLSIAWAVAEYLHNSPEHSAKTMFATHYHELTELAEKLPGAKNYQVLAAEKDGEVVFLHQLQKGKASKSYGIAVAKLAGLPQQAILRAREVLAKLEQYELAVFSDAAAAAGALENVFGRASQGKPASQYSLFAVSNENVVDELREVEIDEFTGDQAKKLLADLKAKIV